MVKPLLAGNWKMHGNANSATELVEQLAAHEDTFSGVDMIVFPPAVHLSAVVAALASSVIDVGGQNMSQHDDGALTGEISGAMLKDIGCDYVLVGHSERRTVFAESNNEIAEKFNTAQAQGLTPVLCVGESLQQRQQGQTVKVVTEQIAAVINLVGIENLCRGVIAYEPVWAIGTGEVATPEQAQSVHAEIRSQLGLQGADTWLLYGGSVNASNAAELFAQPDINGGLVGGASLKAQEFLNIAQLMA
ncbi:triose-phosphate isomerase [Porticoccaceae bacterium]|jgi:triosephosphate isomerase|nr:triose-phosphate isomerase [Porticoccaceae bacterium]MDA8598339.1 triose-phosphate isomerase [Porticoccaceae bacterium]MDA8878109.1 triose-phosphate isomerase [Porticoccaceae bacterium]MDB2395606.1 triose-phosphate isomerase [Porticoccaceae bacterium]MDB2400405.1 triose-phosphate isomerase [Porticoccaceae bacterium]|tara:strand:+ start:708 stop:1448 length:741 start_codon:yes stop_codon:yes gene_type:complete